MSVEQKGFAMMALTGEAEEIIGRTGEAQEIVGADDAAGGIVGVASALWTVGAMVSGPFCAYHGYKRNNGSIGWAIGWYLLSGFFPITPVVAYAQGFAKPIEE